jgi:CheY-like chemotaxis protein
MTRSMNRKPLSDGQKASLRRAVGRANSLGIEQRQLDALLNELDAADGPRPENSHRQHVRRSFRKLAIPMRIRHRHGADADLTVACRNISRSGISVLHSSFLYPGTACAVTLPRCDGRTMQVTGMVVRCAHRRGIVHEIGISFDRPIDTKELLVFGLFADWFSMEVVDPSELVGSVLYIDDSPADRRLFRHHLRNTYLTVTTADDAQSGIELSPNGHSVIVCDYDLDGGAAHLVAALRSRDVQTPVIMITGDTASATPRWHARVNAQAYLAKPVGQKLLLRAIAEFLQPEHLGKGQPFSAGALPRGHPSASLLDGYGGDLHEAASRLKERLIANDLKGCRALCAEIRAAARDMGLKAIDELAEKAMRRLQQPVGIKKSVPHVNRLVEACRRASLRRAG